MQPFGILYASSPRFFIGYWILQRGWVSTRPLFFWEKFRLRQNEEAISFFKAKSHYHRFKLPFSNCHSGVYKG
jgi:hypothetical protein